jgi:hypothetical protein
LDCDQAVALVRYDGDPDVFAALAAAWLADNDIHRPIEPPKPRLYRCNPDFTGEYGWLLGEPDRPGPGTFLGALIVTAQWPEHMCIDGEGERRQEHDWSAWRDRPASLGPPQLGQPARIRNCEHCGRYDAEPAPEQIGASRG